MRLTVASLSTRRSGRVLAASAALGLALSLTACTIGDTEDDDEVATAEPTSQAVTSDQAEDEAPASDTVAAGVDQLILTDEDMPELGWRAVPAEDVSGGFEVLEGFADGVRVEPEHCADIGQEALLAQTEPGAIAIQAGQLGDTSYAVAVTTVTEDLPGRADQVEDCPVMTVTFPMGDEELTTEAQNSLLDLGAPDGVDEFAAVSQDSSMDMLGQEIRTGNVIITGIVRGIGVSVTAAGTGGPVTDEALDTAMEIFTAQVEKIRSS